MKEKLSSIFGSAGSIILFLLSFVIAYAPVVLADLPFWACVVCFLVINTLPLLGTVLTAVLYVYSSILVFSYPFSWYTVVDVICLVLYTLLYVVPVVKNIFASIRERHAAAAPVGESTQEETSQSAQPDEEETPAEPAALSGRSSPEKTFRHEAEAIIRTAVGPSFSQCADAIAGPLDQCIESLGQQMDSWGPDYPYRERAMQILAHIAFALLSSGTYHLYRGMLDPTGEDLYMVYVYCLEFALRTEAITQEQFDDQMSMLHENINSVG